MSSKRDGKQALSAGGAETTLCRRTLLEWLGHGTVLALGGSTLAACLDDITLPGRDGALGDGRGAGDPRVTDDRAGDLVGGDARSTGDPAGPATFPFEPQGESNPIYDGWRVYTVDPQDLAATLASWQLTVDGMVETPVTLTFADLVALTRTDILVDFHCVVGWSIQDVPWNGVHMSRLLGLVTPTSQATHATFHTVGSIYNESLPLAVVLEPKTLLAYGIGGYTLPLAHGFPARLVIPRLLGYKSAKYVTRIELTDRPVNGYWEDWGYSYAADVPSDRLRAGRY